MSWDDVAVLRCCVDDPSDPLLDGFRDLRDPELRRAREAAEGVFVAEGVGVVGRLARSSYRTVAVAVVPEQEERVLAELVGAGGDGGARVDGLGGGAGLGPEVLSGVPLLVVPRPVLDRVVGFPVHRGALALGARVAPGGLEDLPLATRTMVVLEDCNDHENMGAVARSARALGAGALVLSPRCADPLYRRCVRVSMGEVLRLPLIRSERWPDDLARLSAAGVRVVALTPASDAVDLDDVRVGPDDRVAVLLGAEGPGLTEGAMDVADVRVRIPIVAEVDSLNVGHAAAVALHHLAAARRRG